MRLRISKQSSSSLPSLGPAEPLLLVQTLSRRHPSCKHHSRGTLFIPHPQGALVSRADIHTHPRASRDRCKEPAANIVLWPAAAPTAGHTEPPAPLPSLEQAPPPPPAPAGVARAEMDETQEWGALCSGGGAITSRLSAICRMYSIFRSSRMCILSCISVRPSAPSPAEPSRGAPQFLLPLLPGLERGWLARGGGGQRLPRPSALPLDPSGCGDKLSSPLLCPREGKAR